MHLLHVLVAGLLGELLRGCRFHRFAPIAPPGPLRLAHERTSFGLNCVHGHLSRGHWPLCVGWSQLPQTLYVTTNVSSVLNRPVKGLGETRPHMGASQFRKPLRSAASTVRGAITSMPPSLSSKTQPRHDRIGTSDTATTYRLAMIPMS